MASTRHGTAITREGGRITEVHDRYGHPVASISWSGDRASAIALRLPDRREIRVVPRAGVHPLMGEIDRIDDAHGGAITVFGAVDYAWPRAVPPLAAPATLPPGAGSAILNLIALLAEPHGEPLRYRGPYPTAALFDTLLGSFSLRDDPRDALERFTRDTESAALAGAMREVDVDFLPGPHERVWPADDVCVDLRDGLERAFLRGRAYDRNRVGPRRLRHTGDGYDACVELAGKTWVVLARFDHRGDVIEGPHPVPAAPPRRMGDAIPETVSRALGIAIAARAPRFAQHAVSRVLATIPIRWGDAEDDAARLRDGAITVHTALGEALEGVAPKAAFLAIAEAVAPVAMHLAQTLLASDPAPSEPRS